MATGNRDDTSEIDGLDVTVEEGDGEPVLRVSGEIDSYTSPVLRHELARLLDGGASNVVVDLTDTGLIDSTGLGVLVSAASRARSRGGRLLVRCPSPFLRGVFTMTGVDQIMDVVGAVDEHPTG